MKKFNALKYCLPLSLILNSIATSQVNADQFVYEVHCEPTEIEDVARVVQGNIYLALRADKTIKKSTVSVKIRKQVPIKRQLTEAELLAQTGYTFNPSDLSIGMGGDVVGHSCFTKANLLVNIAVTRKDGKVQKNVVTIPVNVPGAYATSGKIIVP